MKKIKKTLKQGIDEQRAKGVVLKRVTKLPFPDTDMILDGLKCKGLYYADDPKDLKAKGEHSYRGTLVFKCFDRTIFMTRDYMERILEMYKGL